MSQEEEKVVVQAEESQEKEDSSQEEEDSSQEEEDSSQEQEDLDCFLMMSRYSDNEYDPDEGDPEKEYRYYWNRMMETGEDMPGFRD